MQCLYALERGAYDNTTMATNALNKSLEQSYAAACFIIYTLADVASYANTEAEKRANKKLPTKEDLNFNTKIAENTIVQAILNTATFKKAVETYKLGYLLSDDLKKDLFRQLIDMPFYQKYIEASDKAVKDDQLVLLNLYNKVLSKNEDYQQLLEEQFPGWIDDQAHIGFLMNQFLEKVTSESFAKQFDGLNINEEDIEFAKDLLATATANEAAYNELIEPKLQNWEIERVASMDMIIMRMALSELLEFPFIPKKVTINEYIEIAKLYSTPKSKDFVNGILDKLMKELEDDGKIVKKGRGLMN